ncbi:MAG: hypothetical protein JWN52_882 [Actinomycetia bacterium]|nr:hypothetical protein [Actinomycetes bacterium]
MPADPSAIAAHAKTLHADSDSLAECAGRLGGIAQRLCESTTVPAWFQDVMNEHVTRCLVASADLATAAARLEEYTSAVTLPPTS